MKVTFYGSLAEAIAREIEVAETAGATVATVRAMLAGRYPDAAATLARPDVRALIDDATAREEDPVPPGSALAFLPPLSGG